MIDDVVVPEKAPRLPSFFRSGWRPSIGWTCAAGLVYHFLLRPLLPWSLAVAGIEVAPLPALDTATLLTVLGGLTSVGAMRTLEKLQDKAQ